MKELPLKFVLLIMLFLSAPLVRADEILHCFLTMNPNSTTVSSQGNLIQAKNDKDFLSFEAAHIRARCENGYCIFVVTEEDSSETRVVTDSKGNLLYSNYADGNGHVTNCKYKPTNGGGN